MIVRPIHLFIIFTIIFFPWQAFAQEKVLIDSNETNLTIFPTAYFIDQHNLPFNKIQQQNFTTASSQYSLGTNAKNTWVRVIVKNTTSSNQKLFLHLPEAFHNKQVNFYEMSNNQLINKALIDLNQAKDNPYIFQGSAIYEFMLMAQEEKTIYVQSVSFSHQWFTLSLLDEKHSKRALANNYNDIAFYVGILFALMIFNLILQFTSSTKENLFYSLYLLAGAIWIAFHYGLLGNSFNWYGSDVFLLHIALLVMPGFLSMFMMQVFETRKNYPTEHKFLKAIILLIAIISTYGLFDIIGALKPASTIALIVIATTLFVSLSILKKGNPLVKYFLLGHIFFIIFNILAILFYKGLIDYHYLSRHGVGIGIMLEALMMAFIISYKIRLLETEKHKLGQQALIDPLTKLYNRRHFFTKADFIIKNQLINARPISVVMLDIDDFKLINDNYGHQAGDQVLQGLSKILRMSISDNEVLARFGGEEFALLLPNHDQHQAQDFLRQLLFQIQSLEVPYQDKTLNITVSIGITEMHKNEVIESVLRRADEALYLAKSSGKNKIASL